MIYFIQGEQTKRVKIGVSFDVEDRIRSLQVGSPDVLHVLGTREGDYSVEALIHEQLRFCRAHGEWFNYGPEVREILAAAGARSGCWARPRATRRKISACSFCEKATTDVIRGPGLLKICRECVVESYGVLTGNYPADDVRHTVLNGKL